MLRTRRVPPPTRQALETATSAVPEAQRGAATCPRPRSWERTGCPGDPLAESEYMLVEEYGGRRAAPAAHPRAVHAATSPVPSVPSAAPGHTAAPRPPCPAPWPPASSQPALPPWDPVPAAFSGQAQPASQAGAVPAARSALGAGRALGLSFSGPPRGGQGRAGRGDTPCVEPVPTGPSSSALPQRGDCGGHSPRACPGPLGSPDPFLGPAPGATQMGKSRLPVDDHESAKARKEGRKKVPEEGIEPEGLRAAGVPLKLLGAPLPNPHPAWQLQHLYLRPQFSLLYNGSLQGRTSKPLASSELSPSQSFSPAAPLPAWGVRTLH